MTSYRVLGLSILLAAAALPASAAETCSGDDVAAAVDGAGAQLRTYNAEAMPKLQARIKQLAARKKWSDAEFEDQAIVYLQDEKSQRLDETANQLLAKIDAMGQVQPGKPVECTRLDDVKSTGIELLAVMKAKNAHLLAKLDAELAGGGGAVGSAGAASAPAQGQPPAAAVTAALKPTAADGVPEAAPAKPGPAAASPTSVSTPAPTQAATASTGGPVTVAPGPVGPAVASGTTSRPSSAGALPAAGAAWGGGKKPVPQTWETTSERQPDTADVALLPPQGIPAPIPEGVGPLPDGVRRPLAPMTPPPPDLQMDEGYTIDEIRDATRGFFGTISTSLAAVIEHAFQEAGRPTGYILGQEGGGAFLGGLRYGKGTLYVRSGGTQRIYWHGPSVGFDVGAAGAQTMFLVYKMREPGDLYRVFTGIDGSAFVVGGVGLTLLGGGGMILAPIRSGIGVRFGANVGYLRFTANQTWNPF